MIINGHNPKPAGHEDLLALVITHLPILSSEAVLVMEPHFAVREPTGNMVVSNVTGRAEIFLSLSPVDLN